MESIKVSLEMPLRYQIGDEVEAHFYEKFEEKYESRTLLGKVTDIEVHFSYIEGRAHISYRVATEYLGQNYKTSL